MRLPFISKNEDQIKDDKNIYKIDVHGELDFDKWVVKESFKRPVVVDFWAPWCAPCRIIGPVLENLAAEAKGRWLLVKLNTEEGENQNLAIQFNIRSIPAVKAFKDGKVIDQFIGALPPEQIRAWLDKFVPNEADELTETAEQLLEKGELVEAKKLFEKALEFRARHPRALFGLAKLLAKEGKNEEALRTLDLIVDPNDEKLEREIAQLKFSLQQGGSESLKELEEKIKANPNDWSLQIEYARTIANNGDYNLALDLLLKVVENSDGELKDKARASMVEIFEILGHDHHLTSEYRQKLAEVLYR